MRCQQCGHANPEGHRFCGMCGAKLQQPAPVALIDDNDPLDLGTPEYRFDDRSHATREPLPVVQNNQPQIKVMRDANFKTPVMSRATDASAVSVVDDRPRTMQETALHDDAVEERGEREAPRRVSGIGGPSLLGLDYDSSNAGFVYDSPRNDGFIYDNDGQTPEYLLEEAPRTISWRAWALVLLLAVGGGLGYMEWRAVHNSGPDIDSLLARNGATIDPNHPVVTPDNAKPKKPADPAAQTSPAQTSKSEDAKSETADQSTKSDTAKTDSQSDTSTAAKSDSAATGKQESAKTGSAETPANAKKAPESDGSNDADDAGASVAKSDETAKPESDGPPAKVAKAEPAKSRAVSQKPAEPKSLGDKDPLILQAEKYIQGRGVRQNCSMGVNLLRQAISAGNPAADVKMGALYWSGTCVTQSNVTAYEWFSRAHSLEPRNRWIERSRSSLWASLSPQEKQRIGY